MKVSREEVEREIETESNVVDGLIFTINDLSACLVKHTSVLYEGKERRINLLRTAFNERELEIKRYERMVELIKTKPFSVQLSYETLVNVALEQARKEIE